MVLKYRFLKRIHFTVENNFILCIETATDVCSVALSQNAKCISCESVKEINAHGQVLTVLIDKILLENNLSYKDLSAVAYSNGPGSYTGLRIGLSVAKGICFGTNVPLIAVSTLQHIASDYPDDYVFPMIDARRMEVYAAMYEPGNKELLSPFACIVPDYNWSHILKGNKVYFIGNGVNKSKEILQQFPDAIFKNDEISAKTLCRLAHKKLMDKDFVDVAYAVPFYLKDANVTEAKKKGL